MNTHLLETNDVIRGSVTAAKPVHTAPDSLVLESSAALRAHKSISSGDSAMMERAGTAGVGGSAGGRVRIDLLSDTMLRVRYAEGETIPENDTPMVVGTFDGPSSSKCDASDTSITLRTPRMSVKVGLDPFALEVCDDTGMRLCAVGGPEKNNFAYWDAFNTGIHRTKEASLPVATECFALHPSEAIYGFGEKFIRLNKVGQTIDLDMNDGRGVTTPRTYKNIPFFMSTRGYGVFFNHSSLMSFWVGSMSAVDIQAAAEDDFLDYYIMTGSLKEILGQYTDITGKGSVPPKWSFGYWQSKISYTSAEETLAIADELRKHEIPCDVIHLDTHWFEKDWLCDLTFDKERFPDPADYIRRLADMGFNLSLWQLPYLIEGTPIFGELNEVEGFVKRADGSIYNMGKLLTPDFEGVMGCIDFTNPAAVEIYRTWLARLLDMGVKVIKTDFGEWAPVDGVYHDGTPGGAMHNLYPLLYNKIVFELTREKTGEGIVWARSAWAGNQRYPVHWGGDNTPNWENMLPQLHGGLSLGMSGFQFWSQDIGGFLGDTGGELLIRWMQWGVFLSHSRIHGSGVRELYRFDPEVLRICRDYLRLRYRLMPYIYGSARDCAARSLPMARPLVLEFQDDPNVWSLCDQYLFGDSLMPAPITEPGTSRRVYLPEGLWVDWWSGARLEGPGWIDVTADIETLPLYVREGALIPLGPVTNYVDEKPTDEIELRVAPFAGDGKSSFTVPLDTGDVTVEYEAVGGTHTVRIGKTDARFTVVPWGGVKPKIEQA